jgi:hypothetical protein
VFSAKGRAVILEAWGNAPGFELRIEQALKARFKRHGYNHARGTMPDRELDSRFQRLWWDFHFIPWGVAPG